MFRMLPGIETLAQHQKLLRDDPDAYRPERCPHCGKGGMQRHGHYERNTPRGVNGCLNPHVDGEPITDGMSSTTEGAPTPSCRSSYWTDSQPYLS